MDNELLKTLLNEGKISTPCYISDEDGLDAHLMKMNKIAGNIIEYCYAMKANPFLTKQVSKSINHIEVCSPGELSICKRLGIPGKNIVFSGVNKTEEDILAALDYEVDVITLESIKHFDLVKRLCKEREISAKVLVRLSSGAQFGMSEEELRYIIKNREDYPYLNIEGIHYFTGTQKKKIEKDIEEIEKINSLIESLKQEYQYECRKFEYGLGLSVPYFVGDDFDNIYGDLEKLVSYVKEAHFSYRVVFELGRFITASSMYYLTGIDDIKSVDGCNICIVDGGIHHLNYYGQNMAMRVPLISVVKMEKSLGISIGHIADSKEWKVCGSLCTFADVLVRKVELDDLELGDVLVFGNTGAYSITEAPALFLSRKMPNIYTYSENNGIRTVRSERESYEINI